MDYRNSGVDIEAGYASVEPMKQYIKCTLRPEVMGGVGGLSGAFSFVSIRGMEDPMFLSGTNDVDTKSKIVFLLDRHGTIGIDCVAVCVSDVVRAGSEPLFFLDYIACGRNVPEKIAAIVSGVAGSCVQAGCALVGGETAEHPGLMPEGEYDLAGFLVSACDRKDLITDRGLKPGDVLIDIVSSGAHPDGFSLVRNIFGMSRENLTRFYLELGAALGEVLPAPTRIYVRALKSAKEAGVYTHAYSHVIGGGLYKNILCMLKDGVHVEIRKDSYKVPVIFRLMAEEGEVSKHVMYGTPNMSVDMAVAVDLADVEKVTEAFRIAGEKSFVIDEYKVGKKGTDLCWESAYW